MSTHHSAARITPSDAVHLQLWSSPYHGRAHRKCQVPEGHRFEKTAAAASIASAQQQQPRPATSSGLGDSSHPQRHHLLRSSRPVSALTIGALDNAAAKQYSSFSPDGCFPDSCVVRAAAPHRSQGSSQLSMDYQLESVKRHNARLATRLEEAQEHATRLQQLEDVKRTSAAETIRAASATMAAIASLNASMMAEDDDLSAYGLQFSPRPADAVVSQSLVQMSRPQSRESQSRFGVSGSTHTSAQTPSTRPGSSLSRPVSVQPVSYHLAAWRKKQQQAAATAAATMAPTVSIIASPDSSSIAVINNNNALHSINEAALDGTQSEINVQHMSILAPSAATALSAGGLAGAGPPQQLHSHSSSNATVLRVGSSQRPGTAGSGGSSSHHHHAGGVNGVLAAVAQQLPPPQPAPVVRRVRGPMQVTVTNKFASSPVPNDSAMGNVETLTPFLRAALDSDKTGGAAPSPSALQTASSSAPLPVVSLPDRPRSALSQGPPSGSSRHVVSVFGGNPGGKSNIQRTAEMPMSLAINDIIRGNVIATPIVPPAVPTFAPGSDNATRPLRAFVS